MRLLCPIRLQAPSSTNLNNYEYFFFMNLPMTCAFFCRLVFPPKKIIQEPQTSVKNTNQHHWVNVRRKITNNKKWITAMRPAPNICRCRSTCTRINRLDVSCSNFYAKNDDQPSITSLGFTQMIGFWNQEFAITVCRVYFFMWNDTTASFRENTKNLQNMWGTWITIIYCTSNRSADI